MNNIFSFYFIDTFFSNKLFRKMKLIYFNDYPDANSKTKSLNFPSKLKTFNNGLEPDNILKLNYKFFSDKYFPVSHPYFYEYMQKNNIPPNKYIKLFHKNIDFSKNENKIKLDCELIKLDKNYFGELFCFFEEEENKRILVFQEKKFDFNNFDESIFDNEENSKNIFSLSFITQKLKQGKTKSTYKNQFKRKEKLVIIHFSDIDEIIEKRCLLLWQAVEIYLKNGKSYFLNLLSEDNKNLLIKELEKDLNIQNLIHKKDFFEKDKLINKAWKNNLISTYENLLLLNKYGSRSFNDSAQYPVFPWILVYNYDKIGEINILNDIKKEKLKDEENELLESSLRILKWPVCMQKENKREDVIYKYNEEEGEQFQHHLGIHYSTSSYIFYYLMRQQPFSNLLIKLQNYQTENPNRMFLSIADSIATLQTTKDSREIIPELYNHFDYLINLNCDFLGIKFDGKIVDDNKVTSKHSEFNIEKNKNPFFKYIYFIIEHKKLLNSKMVSNSINDWIDIIFGVGQYPSNLKARANSCNIYSEFSYEQHWNLKQKYLQRVEECKKDKTKEKKFSLYKTFLVEINMVINFGQVPYQIFKEKYNKREYSKKNIEYIENKNDNEFQGTDNYEGLLIKIHAENESYVIKANNYYNYFEISPKLNKIFVLSEERFMEVIHTTIFNKSKSQKSYFNISFSPIIQKKLPHFLLGEKIIHKNVHSFLYNIKYAFSSFDNNNHEFKNMSKNSIYKSYGRSIIDGIKEMKEKEKEKEKEETNKITYFKFITCRYVDKTFKIHQLPMDKNIDNKSHSLPKIKSFVCEDFVSSCCSISSCQFLIGLKNGKLIQCSLDRKINIKIERYIKCHNGKINSIEINKKYGLIITSGDDNYIIIRKLYDFELLSPIKIKDKLIITLAKVSPLNFLYVLCYDKQKKSKVIYGYTLNGLKFAKSEYGNYENLDFTENGNIVTLEIMKKLCILSGSNLKHIKTDNNPKELEEINKIKNAIWLKYDYFVMKVKNEGYINNRIITYINDKKSLISIDVSDNCFFN